MYVLQCPVYGEDYKEGYVFFSYVTKNLISSGIALFQSSEMTSGLPISHCGVICGPGHCLESIIPATTESDFIKKYVEDPHTIVFLRKPKDWTPEMAQKMIEEGRKHIGEKYSYCGIIGFMFRTVLSWGFKLFSKLRYKDNLLNTDSTTFCSEYVSLCMRTGMGKVGCLAYNSENIGPSTLFEDKEIWADWNANIIQEKMAKGKLVVPVIGVES